MPHIASAIEAGSGTGLMAPSSIKFDPEVMLMVRPISAE